MLSGFEDGSMDVVTCAWGLESMYVHQKAIEVSFKLWQVLPLGHIPTNTFHNSSQKLSLTYEASADGQLTGSKFSKTIPCPASTQNVCFSNYKTRVSN